MSHFPIMTQAQVLYDNRYRDTGAVVTYDGTLLVGFDAINAYDWRDFSLFSQSAGSHLTVQLTAPAIIDSIVLWRVAGAAATATVQTSPDGTTWTTIAAVPLGTAGLAIWTDVPQVPALWYRVLVDVTVIWRQITLGQRLQFPMGQWKDINPPTLTQGVVVENQISVNGSIIGRNLRRFEKSGQISLDYLKPEWVRSSWEAFVTWAIRYPFWQRWNPVEYPQDVAFAAADSITAPKNMSPPPLMHAEMATKFITQ